MPFLTLLVAAPNAASWNYYVIGCMISEIKWCSAVSWKLVHLVHEMVQKHVWIASSSERVISPLAANSPEGGFQSTSSFVRSSSCAVAPRYLTELLRLYSQTRRLRSSEQHFLRETGSRTRTYRERTFERTAPVLCNRLSVLVRMASSVDCFKTCS